MAKIHFIDGEKGGVGKSLFARTIVQYCLDNNLPFRLIEADRSNPDVGEFYSEVCDQVVFSENEKKAYEPDEIFNKALEKPVIVNLPAQVYPAVTDWIERNGLLKPEMLKQHGVEICKWFICTGGHDSVQLFINSARHFEGKVQHIFVRNWGLCDDWRHLDGMEDLQNLLKTQSILVVDFPKFSYLERNLIDQKRITFAAAKESSEFGILSKQRIHTYLSAAYAAIEGVNALKSGSAKKHSSKGTGEG